MTQLNFTLERDFFTRLLKKDREEAFGELMENLLNQFLLAESAEVLQADPSVRNGHSQGRRTTRHARGGLVDIYKYKSDRMEFTPHLGLDF